jgi:mannose-6-phosphate isomerase-like protein (cupin superfamily)
MTNPDKYNINLDIKYSHLELIDVPAIVNSCSDRWFNQTLTAVNDSVVRLGILDGEFHWHRHDDEDEFFFVISGRLLMDLEDRTVELNQYQGITISKGVMHRPRTQEKTVVLMVESATIKPTGS